MQNLLDESESGNPFRPGAGRIPPELAGRDQVLRDVGRLMAQLLATSEGERPIVISGLRGVGKTVLLNEFVRATRRSTRWIAIKVEASLGRSLAQQLARELHNELRKLASPSERAKEAVGRMLRVFRSFQITVDPAGNYGFGFDLAAERGVADSGDFEHDLHDLLEALGLAARTLDMGVLVAIDELQDAARSDLNGLNLALHRLGQDAWPVPVLVIGAGLPSLPSVLADATSYAERLYDYRTLGLLEPAETREALEIPATQRGVAWSPQALAMALDSAQGYPYFVQACGKHVWDARARPDHISLDDARVGLDRAREEVDRGLYQSRWDRATPSQRALMRAMAEDDDRPSAIQDLVARTGRTRPSDLSVARGELIKHGHIYSPDRGFLAFTVPGMSDFIRRKMPG